MRALALFSACAVLQAVLAPPPDMHAAGPLGRRFPGAAGTVLFAGFRPLVVHHLYAALPAAVDEGRTLEALADARLLSRLEPENPRALIYLASLLAYDLSNSERTQQGRLSRILDALAVLAEGERRLPLDPRLPRLRALILHERVALDPDLAPRYQRRTGRDPLDEGRAAYEAALKIAPLAAGLRSGWSGLTLDAARLHLERGHVRRARALLDELVQRLEGFGTTVPALHLELARAWRRLVAGLQGRPDSLAGALDALAGALVLVPPPSMGGTGREELYVWLLALPRALQRAEALAGSGDGRSALSLLEALHNIQALTRNRLAQRGPDGRVAPPTADYEARWKGVLELLSRQAPALRGSVRKLLRPWER